MKNQNYYLKFLAFPVAFAYLEISLHLLVGMSIKYLPLYILFTFSYGFIASALCAGIGGKRYSIAFKIIISVLCIFFCAEYVVRSIFQTFYPFSVMKTAAGNHLGTFKGVVFQTMGDCWLGIVLMLIPAVLAFIFVNDGNMFSRGKHGRKVKLKTRAVVIISLLAAVILFAANLFVVEVLPSKADITPKMLYHSDTDFNDQTERLGLLTMIRLDVKHMVITEESAEFVAPEETEEARHDADEDIDYGINSMNFDFDAMLAGTQNKDLQWLTKYVSSNTATNKNKYTGTMKGYNVIFLTLEGMSGYAISEKYTPTLYRMTHEGFVFTNFYTALHFTSTSNGECQNLLGLYPKNGFPVTMTRVGELKTNCYFSLAQQLGRLGYTNLAYHNNQYDLYGRFVSHNSLGYNYCFGAKMTASGYTSDGRFLVDGKSWPQKDSYMIDQSVEQYINGDDPFNIYYITISGHTPYSWNYAASEYKEQLADSGYSEGAQAYIATCMEVDKALEHLVDALYEAGKLDNTLIVAVPDHVPYSDIEIIEEISGKEFGSSEALKAINESNIDFDVYKSCLIMWSGSTAAQEPVYVNKPCCQVDILPTISNLLGLEYDSRMLSGTDMLSDSDGLVVFSSRCWRSEKGFYNRFTKTFTPLRGEFGSQQEIDDYVERMKTIVANKLDCTSKIIENDFYDYAVKYLKKSE